MSSSPRYRHGIPNVGGQQYRPGAFVGIPVQPASPNAPSGSGWRLQSQYTHAAGQKLAASEVQVQQAASHGAAPVSARASAASDPLSVKVVASPGPCPRGRLLEQLLANAIIIAGNPIHLAKSAPMPHGSYAASNAMSKPGRRVRALAPWPEWPCWLLPRSTTDRGFTRPCPGYLFESRVISLKLAPRPARWACVKLRHPTRHALRALDSSLTQFRQQHALTLGAAR
jgi:hypothetical protein